MKREITCKVVYYGPGFSGKTTNLKYLHNKIAPATRGELVSMATQTDRTLFFDFMPLDLGKVNGWQMRMAMYTVPGQVEYNASRKLILNGVDGVVLVADSDLMRSADNIESLQNLKTNLSELGIPLEELPFVLQYNKRDLKTAMSTERMEEELNSAGVPSFEAVANEGPGVFATLKAISKLLLNEIGKQIKS
jgi:small GTP-binding protein